MGIFSKWGVKINKCLKPPPGVSSKAFKLFEPFPMGEKVASTVPQMFFGSLFLASQKFHQIRSRKTVKSDKNVSNSSKIPLDHYHWPPMIHSKFRAKDPNLWPVSIKKSIGPEPNGPLSQVSCDAIELITSCWLNQPPRKIWVKLGSSSPIFGVNIWNIGVATFLRVFCRGVEIHPWGPTVGGFRKNPSHVLTLRSKVLQL